MLGKKQAKPQTGTINKKTGGHQNEEHQDHLRHHHPRGQEPPNNNHESETQTVVTEQGWTLKDLLENQGIPCDQDGSITYVLDEDGHRTGEAYAVISIADTGEPISEQF